MPQKIIIVRHGETQWNIERRLQGWTDIPLNKNGRAQADKVALRISSLGESITAVYSSDHKRAHTTASHIAKKLNLKPLKRRSLREDRMGIFEGWQWEKDPDDVRDKLWAERTLSHERGDIDWKPEGGESIRDHANRVKKFLDQIESHHHSESIIIVTHGGTINRFMEIFGFKKVTEDYISYKNTSITILTRKDNGYKLELHNDISHL